MPKCDFKFSEHLFLRTPLDGCFCHSKYLDIESIGIEKNSEEVIIDFKQETESNQTFYGDCVNTSIIL